MHTPTNQPCVIRCHASCFFSSALFVSIRWPAWLCCTHTVHAPISGIAQGEGEKKESLCCENCTRDRYRIMLINNWLHWHACGWKSPKAVNSEPLLPLLRVAVEAAATFWGLTALIFSPDADKLCPDALTGPGPPWQQEAHCFDSLLGHVYLSVYWVCVREEREEVHDQLTWMRGGQAWKHREE